MYDLVTRDNRDGRKRIVLASYRSYADAQRAAIFKMGRDSSLKGIDILYRSDTMKANRAAVEREILECVSESPSRHLKPS